MTIINDNNCGLINSLPKRDNLKSVNKNQNCDWIIILQILINQAWYN